MTETTKRPIVTSTGLITAAIALTLPFIADRLIVSAMTEAKQLGLGAVIGMAVYTAVPFLLLDSAMRPRRRVRLALWLGLALTILIWAAFAWTGYSFQQFSGAEASLLESCEKVKENPWTGAFPSYFTTEEIEQCTSYRRLGNAHVGLYMLSMIWPAAVIAIMGAAAKIGETEHDA